jgi:predicted ATPase
MKIRAIRIQNYKSFADTGWVQLGNHFTVLVGQNNVGKSAFLESFAVASRSPVDVPHRSSKRAPGEPLPRSRFAYRLLVEGVEHKRKAVQRGISTLPTSQILQSDVVALHYERENIYEVEYRPAEGQLLMLNGPTYDLFEDDGSNRIAVARVNDDRDDLLPHQILKRSNTEDVTKNNMYEMMTDSTFVFDAERYNIGRCAVSETNLLQADAGNLPYMLMRLSKDYAGFERFQILVKEVLPSIRRVLIAPAANQVEISIQSDPSYREDLAIPLDQSGTGVAQVLAILYVAVAYRSAQIVIDEPNSFLHPGATRRLLDVLKRFENHQFLLTTHTAEVISIVEPEVLLLLTWNAELGETNISSSSGADVQQIKLALGELGVAVGDVFGFDVVVFVEGPTEAACFPLLVPHGNKLTINFVPMREASAFSVRDPSALFDIYRRAVEGGTILPQLTRFSFDREGRTETQIVDIVRAAKGAASFLPGMMYETHLLHAGALTALLNGLPGESGHTVEVVGAFLESERSKHSVAGVKNVSTQTCDAAKLIVALLARLTDGRYQIYNKIEHGKSLTSWLLEHDPEQLSAVRQHVASLLEPRKEAASLEPVR